MKRLSCLQKVGVRAARGNALGAIEAPQELQRRTASLRANAKIEILLPRPSSSEG